MPPAPNYVPCFVFLIRLKNNSSKVKNKTQSTLIKWDTQSGNELVLKRKILILEQNVNWIMKL